MELTVVGCSGSVSGPDSPASCYLVQAPYQGRTFSLVLDLGPGSFGALYRYLDPREVDAVALSHLHPDHCLDLCALYVAGQHSATAPWPRIPVYAPAGAGERMARAYEVPLPGPTTEPGPGIAEHFDYRGWQPRQQIGPFTVETALVAHPVPCYAVRVADDRGTLVFSGDTGPSTALTGLATGADLLLVEAAFLDGPGLPTDLHLTPTQAAQAGAEAGVGTVVLTHVPPWHDRALVLAQAEPHFPGPVRLAETGGRWTVG